MATSGIIPGTLMALYVGGVKVALLTANSFSQTKASRKTANKDSGVWETSVYGRGSWSMSASGFFSQDATYGFSNLKSAQDAGTIVTVRTSTAVSGDKYYEGTALITELSANFPDNENSDFSVTFEGTGALSETTI